MEATFVQTLTGLGLTSCQSRVYLQLLQLGPSSAKTIASASKVTRQDVYRIIPNLQKLGLIEVAIGSPTHFNAVPVEFAIAILLERKKSEQEKLHKGIEDLLHNFKKEDQSSLYEEQEFLLVPHKEADVRRRRKAISNAKETFDAISSKKRFSQAVFHMYEKLNQAAQRGVKIRLMTEKLDESDPLPKELESLSKNPQVEIRHLSGPLKAAVIIVDRKQASILTLENADWAQSPSLWSRNPSFVAIVQDHFEATWQKAQPAEYCIATTR